MMSENYDKSEKYFYYLSPNSWDKQIDYYKLKSEFNSEGLLSLKNDNILKTSLKNFFNYKSKEIKKYDKIKFFSVYNKNTDQIDYDLDWVFVEGINVINHWGSWTTQDQIQIGFFNKSKFLSTMNINIVDVKFDNDVNFSELNLKINNVLVNKIKFMNNSDFSKSKIYKINLPKQLLNTDKPNVILIEIKNFNNKNLLIQDKQNKTKFGIKEIYFE